MGIYEALVWSPAGLAAPGGVTFPPNSASYDADMTTWNDLLPMLTTQMFEGRYIMAIIQARNTGRPWSDAARNFQFKPTEDCMLAAYCVSANLGKPYTSGLCSGDYVKNMMAAAQTGIAVENYRPAQRASTDLFQVFQCSAKGTKLAFRGCLMLINSYKKRGLPDVEATVKAAADMAQKDQWGWKGGIFPALVNRPPGARPRSAGGWTTPRA